MHITEVVRRHFGWCPKSEARLSAFAVRPWDDTGDPSGSGSWKTHALNWLGVFRNQLLIMALYFSVVGILLSVILGGINLPMFVVGIVEGSLISVFLGIRFWKTMNKVRDEGAVFLVALYDKTTIAISLIVAMVPVVVFLGAIPGVNMTMYNSIIGGFVFIMFWWLLFVTRIWESQTQRHLLSDGLMLTLAREA